MTSSFRTLLRERGSYLFMAHGNTFHMFYNNYNNKLLCDYYASRIDLPSRYDMQSVVFSVPIVVRGMCTLRAFIGRDASNKIEKIAFYYLTLRKLYNGVFICKQTSDPQTDNFTMSEEKEAELTPDERLTWLRERVRTFHLVCC